MAGGIKLVTFPVTDVAAAKAVMTGLTGVEPYADAPYYVGFRVDGPEIGLVPGGHEQGMTGPIAYWDVPDIAAALAELTEAGATIGQEPRNVGGGMLVATVVDGDGNVFGLRQP
jgi:predicted enzyme related to lactoylglutathione lyase